MGETETYSSDTLKSLLCCPHTAAYSHKLLCIDKYLKFRRRVKNCSPLIDNKAPSFSQNIVTKSGQRWSEGRHVQMIQEKNRDLMIRIFKIEHEKSRLDNDIPRSLLMWRPNSDERRRKELVWIAKKNLKFYNHLQDTQSAYDTAKWEKEYLHWEHTMRVMARFPHFYDKKKPTCQPEELACEDRPPDLAALIGMPKKFPRCYLDITGNGAPLGRIVIMLRTDVAPMTSANFLALCTGQRGISYKGCEFHHIVPNLIAKSGDTINQNGTSGRSIYGQTFPDENFCLTHSKTGVVAMANTGPDTNISQFYITMKPLRSLDGKNVVFGRVVKGNDTLIRINNFGTKTGRPLRKVYIDDCGLLSK